MFKRREKDINHLWQNFIKGNHSAFTEIYNSLISPLYSYGRKLTKNHDIINDSIQEIFLDVFQKGQNPNANIRNPKAYLIKALRNSILKKIEKERKTSSREVDHVMDEFFVEYSFQERMIADEVASEIHKILQKAISQLSPRKKEIIYLKFEESLSYKEIAQIMNITVESAQKQMHRTLLSLRENLENINIF